MSETAIIEITPLLKAAKTVFREIVLIENGLLRDREALLNKAWTLGALLNLLKEEVGHGRWLLWLEGNFKELGKDAELRERNAQRCMKLARENPVRAGLAVKAGNSTDLGDAELLGLIAGEGAGRTRRHPSSYTDESVRKFMWGYIPEKERPELEGNRKLKAGAHYLSFVNHFAKFDRQVRVGLIPMPPVELFRTECEATLRRIIEIGGKEWVLTLL